MSYDNVNLITELKEVLASPKDGQKISMEEREFLDYIWLVNDWGIQRNILAAGGASALSQIKKLREEVDELRDALASDDTAKIKDGLGDCLVVLVQISRLSGIPLNDALHAAWEDIRNRKGKMVNGIFVKET